MEILFIYARHSEFPKDSTLTKDLSDEFHRQGHKVTVVTLQEKKYGKETSLKIENGYEVLRVKSGNYFNVKSKIEKGMTTALMPYILKKAIIENLRDIKFDLIYTHTPFMANPKLLSGLKKYYKCPVMINLWDIFPQNAVDLGMISNKILINIFKRTEKKMYECADYIGCMSKGNLEYMRKVDSNFQENKYFVLKNWAKLEKSTIENINEIREKYGYKEDDFIVIFGGNMGKPQKLENLLELAKYSLNDKKIKFLFVGNGSEKERLEKTVVDNKLENVKFIEQIPREDYEKLTAACNLGLVSLDERFTVPNFPSKTTDYFKLKLPILASLDKCSSEDYGKLLQDEVKAGLFAKAGDIEELYQKLIMIYSDKDLREQMSENGRKYYEKELGVEKAYKTIMKQIIK